MRGRGGVRIKEVVIGSGAIAKRGVTVSVRYDGYLNRGDAFQRGVVTSFKLGARRCIAGLEYGVEGMRTGGRRRIHVPPHLGYRDQSVPGIPANAKLTFDVELLSVDNQDAA